MENNIVKSKGLINKVKEAGIIGAGGAGFPTHIKYNAEVDYVIANGAECEPLLRVDQQLMIKYADEIITAILEVKKQVNAKEAVIALKEKYKKAIDVLTKASKGRVRLHLLKNVYPAGDEQVIVYEVTKRIVPEGGIPLNCGVVVSNVHTLLWVYGAMQDRPVTYRWVTVTGEVNQPKTIKVPIGTSIKDAVDYCGGIKIKDYKIINGGPMMGKLTSLDEQVTKTTSGLIVLPSDHYAVNFKYFDLNLHIKTSKAACCQCTNCTTVCPRYLIGHRLEPHLVMRGISFGVDNAVKDAPLAFLCCECQLCYFACPMDLAPGMINALLKKKFAEKGIKNPYTDTPDKVHIMREYRLQSVPRLVRKLGLKDYDKDAPMEEKDYIPERVKISLRQHIGKPSIAVVKEGAKVKCGQLIAEAAEGVSARVHASIDGVVKSVQGDFVVISRK